MSKLPDRRIDVVGEHAGEQQVFDEVVEVAEPGLGAAFHGCEHVDIAALVVATAVSARGMLLKPG